MSIHSVRGGGYNRLIWIIRHIICNQLDEPVDHGRWSVRLCHAKCRHLVRLRGVCAFFPLPASRSAFGQSSMFRYATSLARCWSVCVCKPDCASKSVVGCFGDKPVPGGLAGRSRGSAEFTSTRKSHLAVISVDLCVYILYYCWIMLLCMDAPNYLAYLVV